MQSDPQQVLHDLAGRAELLCGHDAAAGGRGGRGDIPVMGPRAPQEYQAPRAGQGCFREGDEGDGDDDDEVDGDDDDDGDYDDDDDDENLNCTISLVNHTSKLSI